MQNVFIIPTFFGLAQDMGGTKFNPLSVVRLRLVAVRSAVRQRNQA